MKPTVGRIVHYVVDGKCLAALVAGPSLTLAIADPTTQAVLFKDNVQQSETKDDGCWHWPEREDLMTEYQESE